MGKPALTVSAELFRPAAEGGGQEPPPAPGVYGSVFPAEEQRWPSTPTTTPDRPDTPRNRGDRDAPHISPATPAEDARTILLNEVSWGAVFAGVVVALVTQLLLNMLGLGIGVATLDPGTRRQPERLRRFSIGAGLWWTLSGILASLAGGYAAGRLSGRPKEATAAWHGLTAWAFTTLVIFYLLSSAVGGVLGGVYNTRQRRARRAGPHRRDHRLAAAPALSQAADPFAAIERSVREASGGDDPAALRDAAVTAVRGMLTGDPAQAQEARERAAQAVARARNVPIEQAREQVAGYEQQYRQTVEQARRQATEAADAAARVVSRGALFGFFALALGAVAAWFGGRAGAVYPTLTDLALLGRARRP